MYALNVAPSNSLSLGDGNWRIRRLLGGSGDREIREGRSTFEMALTPERTGDMAYDRERVALESANVGEEAHMSDLQARFRALADLRAAAKDEDDNDGIGYATSRAKALTATEQQIADTLDGGNEDGS